MQAIHYSFVTFSTLPLVFFAPKFFSTTLESIPNNNVVFNRLAAVSRTAAQAGQTTMHCIHCDHEDTRVIETREAGQDLRRRRECPACGDRFTTYERVERQPIRVVKKDGSREIFDRTKVKRGIMLACEKRPVTEDEIERAVQTVEDELRKIGENELPSRTVGDNIMRQLRKLDQVAYIRFASVYKEFRDVRSFEKEIKVLTRGN